MPFTITCKCMGRPKVLFPSQRALVILLVAGLVSRAPSHARLRARDHYTPSTLSGGKRRSESKFTSHYTWGTNRVSECKMDVKSTWIPTWHQVDHVSCSLELFCKTHLLEVGLTQHWETMALKSPQPLIYSISSCVRIHMNWNPMKSKNSHWSKGWRLSKFTSHTKVKA